MDLSEISDTKELKAMAYDQIAIKEQAEQNLRLINARLGQLLEEEQAQLAEEAPSPKGRKK